ncbi:cyclophilin-like fold protein [Thioclava nitratireducens]|uniref:cyclophilin-like fold protein n=1 Tax=Thioclava nitratireducens TaxID=1915078 RepID=UPI0014399D83
MADLPRELDATNAPRSYEPKTGDITLDAPWGNLAIFYKPFANSPSLVRLGTFDGSVEVLMSNPTVRFELAE